MSRRGSLSSFAWFCLSVLLIAAFLTWQAFSLSDRAQDLNARQPTLKVYAAAAIAGPLEEIAAEFKRRSEFAVSMERIGGSGDLAGQIDLEFQVCMDDGADLFVSADAQQITDRIGVSLDADPVPIAVQRPVIAVPADSTATYVNLKSLSEVQELRFGICSTNAAIGGLTRKLAADEGVGAWLEQNKATESENVMALAQALAIGSIDAAVLWNTTVAQVNQHSERPTLKVVSSADWGAGYESPLLAAVVSRSKNQTEAWQFIQYLTESDFAKTTITRAGFQLPIRAANTEPTR
jgi:ABC-type molybdate transport system substrate-binding protein